MKKYTIKLIALLMFASVAASSCSLEYREHRRSERHDRYRDRDRDHDDRHNDHYYNRY